MLNSDLLFTISTAAAAFGAAVILAPSGARTDAPSRIYADGGAEVSEIRKDTATFSGVEPIDGVHKVSTSQSDPELRASGGPAVVRNGRKAPWP
jgi:hypothetical protein